MPVSVSIAERNDVASATIAGAVSPAPGFSIVGIARAGTSSSAIGTWFGGTYGDLKLNKAASPTG